MKKGKAFPKTEIIRQALEEMPADRPREAMVLWGWLCNDGHKIIPADVVMSLDDVEQLLPRLLAEKETH